MPRITYCNACGARCNNSKTGFCKDHWRDQQRKDFGQTVLGSLTSTHARHRHQTVRNHAHRIAKLAGLLPQCVECGYTKHVELCHKKPIHAFPLTATLSEINAIDNLVFLCPNHHWELDQQQGQSFGFGARPKRIMRCCDCGTPISNSATRCIVCSNRHTQTGKFKIEWPSIDDLRSMIAQTSYFAVGKVLGVSDNAIRAHLKRYG